MWSLYLKKEADSQSDEETLGNNLFSYTGEQLEPMKFSNGKTQQDVVEEILKSIKEGNKIIFLKGVCGSGKSAIALNLAKHFKKTAIVVPIKTLQEQYEQDYTKDKFILKDDKNPLNISIIKGRNNFMSCFASNLRADSPELPCTIELREKNSETIRRYLKMNPDVKEEDFSSVSDVRRMSIAPICPHWNPILPAEVSAKPLEKAKKKKKSWFF